MIRDHVLLSYAGSIREAHERLSSNLEWSRIEKNAAIIQNNHVEIIVGQLIQPGDCLCADIRSKTVDPVCSLPARDRGDNGQIYIRSTKSPILSPVWAYTGVIIDPETIDQVLDKNFIFISIIFLKDFLCK